MREWTGPFKRQLLRTLGILMVLMALATFIIGYIILGETLWKFLAFSIAFCAYLFGAIAYVAWYGYRAVWSSVLKDWETDCETVLDIIEATLGVPSKNASVRSWVLKAERRMFEVGQVHIIVEKGGYMTTVYVGPLEDGTEGEVERLKVLVDEALG